MALTKIANIPGNLLDLYSKKLLIEAEPKMYFKQFVDYKLEFGMSPGERIKFTVMENLGKGGVLANEDTPIDKKAMTTSEKFITLGEFGNAAAFSRRASVASIRSLLEDAKKLLGRDYAIVMDEYLRDIFLSTSNKYYAAADGSDAGALNATAGGFDDTVVDALVEVAKNLLIPKLSRGGDQYYAFIGTPRQIRQIRNSAGWLDARKYVDTTQMLNGEAGRLNDVVFLDTTQMPNKTNATIAMGANGAGGIVMEAAGAAGVDVSRGVLIGADAVGYGASVPIELIPGVPEDFNRKQSIAWYTIGGGDILNDYIIDVYTSDADI